jgi:ComF family protein
MYSDKQTLLRRLESTFFPFYCLVCQGKSDQALEICTTCESQLPFLKNACQLCARQLPVNTPLSSNKFVCGACQQNPPLCCQTVSLFEYAEPIRSFLTQLKFNHQLRFARLLGTLFTKHIIIDEPIDWLIPVPLHKKRQCVRGFNQALELCRVLTRHYNIPIKTEGCMRQKATAAQSRLKKHARRQNMASAFYAIPDSLTASRVIIVDDTLTTGHTTHALAKALLSAGAHSCRIWTVARAVDNASSGSTKRK